MGTRRFFLAGSAALLGFCDATRPSLAQTKEMTVAVSSTSFVLGGLRIGEKAGIFIRNGVALRVTVMNSGSAAMAAMLGGSVPFAVSGPSEALAARARGRKVVIAANLYRGFAGSLVLAKTVADKLGVAADAPLKDRFKALDGLIVAVPSATSALLAPMRGAAEQAGAQVRFTYLAQGTMPAALENGAIRGMVASFPFAGTPILRGTGVLWIDGPGGELPPDLLPASSSTVQTTAATLKSDAATVHRMQKCVQDIADYIKADQEAARQALAAAYPQLDAKAIEFAFQRQWRNWTKPVLTEADIRQERKLLEMSVKLPDLDKIDPKDVLAPWT